MNNKVIRAITIIMIIWSMGISASQCQKKDCRFVPVYQYTCDEIGCYEDTKTAPMVHEVCK